MPHLYRTFNNYLIERFGTKVYRVPLDAGFTCPNRDGMRAFGGCTFCDDRGSGAPTIKTELNIQQQLEHGIDRIAYRYGVNKFLAYFQAFSNTYAPEAVLQKLYDIVLAHKDVVGLCIGTRPDCVPNNILDLLAKYHEKTFVWLELGLQSAFDQTLQTINRGHTAEEFFDAVKRAKQRGLHVATHLMFGLPGEDRSHMMETVRQVIDCNIDGIKIHQLCIYKGTPMEAQFLKGELPMISEEEYVELVADTLEMLPPEMIVMRLVAEGTKDEIVAPKWALNKFATMDKINAELARRGTRQGSCYKQTKTVSSIESVCNNQEVLNSGHRI